LKQFFDDNKRVNVASSSSSSKQRHYSDARQSYLPQDELFDGKNRSEFERVKQKFDRSHSSSSHRAGPSSGSKSRKSSERFVNPVLKRSFDEGGARNNMNINESAQFFENESFDATKMQYYQNQFHTQASNEKPENNDLTGSFNLDGLKISDSEGDNDVSN